MLTLLLLTLAAPAGCTDTVHQCRACTIKDKRQVCSNIGIACQPKLRTCPVRKPPEPATAQASAKR